jgi:lantibiotic modifying enzyme
MTAPVAAPGRLLDAALDAADTLAGSALVDGDEVRWVAEVVTGLRDGVAILGHGDVGTTLYDGSAGIALALAAAARSAQGGRPDAAPRLAAIAAPAARTALAGIGTRTAPRGLFDGGTGVALAALRVGLLLSDADLVDRAAAAARDAAGDLVADVRRPGADPEPDLIGGVAGDVLGLLQVGRIVGDPGFLVAAREAAGFLAEAAVPQTWGGAWRTGAARADGPPLLGFSHGAAGIALALEEVAQQVDDARLRQAAREGIEYERGWYDPDAVNWPDLRQEGVDDNAAGALRAWCHGALGIGIARMRTAVLTGEPLALAEASGALQAARDEVVAAGSALHAGQARDVTPCHGLAGAVEVFLVAARAFDEPAHARAASRAATLLVAMREAAGTWPCGLPGAGEVPGLMTGVAGVVLTLLRATNAGTLATPLLPGPSGW